MDMVGEKTDAKRDRVYSASSVSGMSTDSYKGGDITIGDMESIDEILAEGCSINFYSLFFTPLHFALLKLLNFQSTTL